MLNAIEVALEAMGQSGDPLLRVFAEAFVLQHQKSSDYNRSVPRKDYFPFGRLSYAQMIWVKAMRLRSLAHTDAVIFNESFMDTLLDLINYAGFAAVEEGELPDAQLSKPLAPRNL